MKKGHLGVLVLKRSAGLMLWAASGLVPSQASNDLVSSLGTCANGISQPYTTTTHNSTAIVASQADPAQFALYSSLECGGRFSPIGATTSGTLPLTGGAFYICPGAGPGSLAAIICAFSEGSIRLIRIPTNAGYISVTGSCITYACTGSTLTSWTLQSTSTLLL